MLSPNHPHRHSENQKQSSKPTPPVVIVDSATSPAELTSPQPNPQTFPSEPAALHPPRHNNQPRSFPNRNPPRTAAWNPSNIFDNDRFITYYVDYIPDHWDSKYLFWEVEKVEEPVDVVIPAKRSVRNTKFGFVRFVRNNHNDDRRREALNAIVTGDGRLWFSESRYNRSNRGGPNVRSAYGHNIIHPQKENEEHRKSIDPSKERALGSPVDERTYANVVSGQAMAVVDSNTKNTMAVTEVQIEANMADKQWLLRSAVGTARDGKLRGSKLLSNVGVKSLGGDLFLITFCSKEEMNQALNVDFIRWSEVFSDIHPWRPEDVNYRRICWFKFEGVPLHIWDEQGFRKLVEPLGNLVQIHPWTTNWTNVEAALIQVMISQNCDVPKEIKVIVNDRVFNVKVSLAEEVNSTVEAGSIDKENMSGYCPSAFSPFGKTLSPKRKILFGFGESLQKGEGGPSRGSGQLVNFVGGKAYGEPDVDLLQGVEPDGRGKPRSQEQAGTYQTFTGNVEMTTGQPQLKPNNVSCDLNPGETMAHDTFSPGQTQKPEVEPTKSPPIRLLRRQKSVKRPKHTHHPVEPHTQEEMANPEVSKERQSPSKPRRRGNLLNQAKQRQMERALIKSMRLNQRLFEQASRRGKRFKMIKPNGSLVMEGSNRSSDSIPKRQSHEPGTAKEMSADVSRVRDTPLGEPSSEAVETLVVYNQTGLVCEKPEGEVLQKIQSVIDEEVKEWEENRED